MSDLRELYQEMVLDHTRRPRNLRVLADANRAAEGFNPFCGDRIKLYLKVEDGIIEDVGFQGAGCAISTSSASMMTESVKGKSIAEAEAVFNAFHEMLTRAPGDGFDRERLGELEILSGVSDFPIRVKCATLSWHTLRAALKGTEQTVSTEEPEG